MLAIFDNVSFKYKNTERFILKDVNLRLEEQEHVAIIGPSGSGKSTILDLLLGFIRPTSGTIRRNLGFSCEGPVGYVPQSVYLLDDTIENNILFGEKLDKNKLNRAIEDAELMLLVNSLELKEQSLVGEKGAKLSGGERQRIGIARALYRNSDILILDEATSALDKSTEIELLKTIEKISKNKSLIMITHQLSNTKICNKLLHITDGQIIEGPIPYEYSA